MALSSPKAARNPHSVPRTLCCAQYRTGVQSTLSTAQSSPKNADNEGNKSHICQCNLQLCAGLPPCTQLLFMRTNSVKLAFHARSQTTLFLLNARVVSRREEAIPLAFLLHARSFLQDSFCMHVCSAGGRESLLVEEHAFTGDAQDP
eukprot:scaffold106636_cov18-Tisochrysis_lutea.AAC.1